MERIDAGDILMDDAGKQGVEVMALLEPRPYDAMEREFQQVSAPTGSVTHPHHPAIKALPSYIETLGSLLTRPGQVHDIPM